jgi:15-cis-phytoene synthase
MAVLSFSSKFSRRIARSEAAFIPRYSSWLILVVAVCGLLRTSDVSAWTASSPLTRRINWSETRLSVATPSSLLSDDSVSNVMPSNTLLGRVLDKGGYVYDYANVQSCQRAEEALALAKEQALQSPTTTSATALMGINQDVISQVGHELGQFVSSPAEIQDVARYLQLQNPNFFNSAAATAYTPEQIARYEEILERAYEEAGEVTAAYAKTFYLGTQLLPSVQQRRSIWAVYVWCRRTDEIVDAPRELPGDAASSWTEQEKEQQQQALMMADLAQWELRLENLWKNGQVVDVYDLCLLDCLVRYGTHAMDITPYRDMIRGMLMDVPTLGQTRYSKFDNELHLYCYRVAGTVGLMSLPIFGTAAQYTYDMARYVVVLWSVLASDIANPFIHVRG